MSLANQSIGKKLSRLFETIDREVLEFQKASGLSCAQGCGKCCLSPTVETTPVEMSLIVQDLLENGEFESYYRKAEKADFKGPCVFYKADPLFPDKGRCAVYPFRPSVCRLFGFAATTDKHDRPQLLTCKVIKEKQPQAVVRAQEAIDRNHPVPIMRKFAGRMIQIDPLSSDKSVPINTAFKIALEKIFLNGKFRGEYADRVVPNHQQ